MSTSSPRDLLSLHASLSSSISTSIVSTSSSPPAGFALEAAAAAAVRLDADAAPADVSLFVTTTSFSSRCEVMSAASSSAAADLADLPLRLGVLARAAPRRLLERAMARALLLRLTAVLNKNEGQRSFARRQRPKNGEPGA